MDASGWLVVMVEVGVMGSGDGNGVRPMKKKEEREERREVGKARCRRVLYLQYRLLCFEYRTGMPE